MGSTRAVQRLPGKWCPKVLDHHQPGNIGLQQPGPQRLTDFLVQEGPVEAHCVVSPIATWSWLMSFRIILEIGPPVSNHLSKAPSAQAVWMRTILNICRLGLQVCVVICTNTSTRRRRGKYCCEVVLSSRIFDLWLPMEWRGACSYRGSGGWFTTWLLLKCVHKIFQLSFE
jgi:hypothetical protein